MSSTQAPQVDSKAATQKDAMFFFHILNNMKNNPDVDWDVVAALSGYNNAGTARTRFGQIKRKLSAISGIPSASPKGPRTSPKKKGDEVGLGGPISPTKVTKKRGKKLRIKAKSDSDSDEAIIPMFKDKTEPEDEKLEG